MITWDGPAKIKNPTKTLEQKRTIWLFLFNLDLSVSFSSGGKKKKDILMLVGLLFVCFVFILNKIFDHWYYLQIQSQVVRGEMFRVHAY